ncbi:uncharacterized protein LOC129774978 [Toxorhynchites rutilus septentrionalis]|uniref:uncharacterized protein LOC129774978 n=1 Tax=Toxorhynchites rutilus septentrionalis TaxID=329112 RepID=UPI00247B01F1|nr:uncharacterized protein LOC129774978 [Toxorhynchites rutilus septentrionalis]
MIPVAGNIQTARKNGLSQNYPFRRDEDDREQYCDPLPPSEYDEKFATCRYERKLPLSKRDIQREQLRKNITQMVIKEHYETLRRQEAERMPLRKQPDYYMTQEATSREPQYPLYKTDDMVTYWSYGARTNSARRRNTSFTKPIGERLDQQFG